MGPPSCGPIFLYMDYVKYISTPKNTAEADPLKTRIKLTRGRLAGGWLYFPTGPAGLLHFYARIGNHQIIPFNTGESYNLNRAVVPFHLRIDLLEPPYIIECVTWNDSTEYDHALTVCFFLIPQGEGKYNLQALKEALEVD